MEKLHLISDINRPCWNKVWMNIAEVISTRSHHLTFKVGAIIVTEDNTQVLSVGYNGNAAGLPNKIECEDSGKSGLIHAEINALLKLDYNNYKNKKMYLTLSPCINCAKCIINSGIKEVYYKEEYRCKKGINLLKSLNIKVEKYNE